MGGVLHDLHPHPLSHRHFFFLDQINALHDAYLIVWADDSSAEPQLGKSGSYVIAMAMDWHFLP